jgi:hypothetical protein
MRVAAPIRCGRRATTDHATTRRFAGHQLARASARRRLLGFLLIIRCGSEAGSNGTVNQGDNCVRERSLLNRRSEN